MPHYNQYFKLWVMGFLLAFSILIAKQLIVMGFNPVLIASMQCTGSVIYLSFFGLKNTVNLIRQHRRYFFVASLLGFTIPQLVTLFAVSHVGASVTSLTYAMPLFLTYFISAIVTGSKIKVRPLVWMMMAGSGTLLYLIKPDVLSFSPTQLGWLIVLLVAPISLSIANVYRSHCWPSAVPVFKVALLTNGFSLASYLVIIVAKPIALPTLSILTGESLGYLACLMLLSAFGQIFLFSLQKNTTPAFVGQTGSITTLIGGLFAFILFDEGYQISTLVGSILILIGVSQFSRSQVSTSHTFSTNALNKARS